MQAFSLMVEGAGAFKDAVVLGQGLPKSVGGQPASYYWKEVIRCGSYTHPQTGQTLEVTPGRMDRWLANFRRMRLNGVKVYVPVNHSRRTEDNRGYVVDARRRGESLELLHQLIGEDAARDAARSEVSLRIVSGFKDGLGRVYDEAIEHASLVVDPVVPGQGDFQNAEAAVAASRGGGDEAPRYVLAASAVKTPNPLPEYGAREQQEKGADMTATQEQTGAIAELMRDDEAGKTVTAQNALDVLIAFVKGLKSRFALSRQELADKAREIESLSRTAAPQAMDAHTLSLLSRSLATERHAAIAAGGISPALAKELDELLCDEGKPSGIALSQRAGSDEPLAFRIWDILRRNRPLELGQRSGVQALSRVVAGDEAGAKLPYEEMAARYNGRGR